MKDTVFFILSKTLGILTQPLPLFLVLGGFLTWKFAERGKRAILILPYLFMGFLSTSLVSNGLIGPLEEKYPPENPDNLKFHKVTIVLGGSINNLTKYPNQVELNSAAERLFCGVELYRKKKTEYIVFTGGSGALFFDAHTEAQIAERFFQDMGVPSKNVILEEESRNTKENATKTLELLKKRGWEKEQPILITSAFHMDRSVHIFQKFGISVTPYPCDFRSIHPSVPLFHKLVPNSYAFENSSIALKEWVGKLVYQFLWQD